jgi:hypothetical protein
MRHKSSEDGRRQISSPHAGTNQTGPKHCRIAPLLRTVDSTLLTALSAIAAQQSNGTQAVTEVLQLILAPASANMSVT